MFLSYLDDEKRINKPEVVSKIKEVFELKDYSVEFDSRYCCRNCVDGLFGKNYEKI